MRMTKDQVVAVGTRAIEARFPGATKGRTFAAFMITDGYWTISVQRGGGRAGLAEATPLLKSAIATEKS
jgi:hypothetical protein